MKEEKLKKLESLLEESMSPEKAAEAKGLLADILGQDEKKPPSEEDERNGLFWHGTSNKIVERGKDKLLPADVSGIIREERNSGRCSVFMTDSLMSAQGYAMKAARKFGGIPVVYAVKPEGETVAGHNHEFTAKAADIEKVECVYFGGKWNYPKD